MKITSNRGGVTRRYLLAFLAPAVVASLMQITWPFFQHSPVLPYLLAVILCAWYGSLGPGLLSVAISLLLTDFFFIEPYFSILVFKQTDLIKVLLFAVVGPSISVMSKLMHQQKRRAEINFNSLRASEERYRKLAENFPNGTVITYDKDLRVTFIAGRGLQESGVLPDFLVGKSLCEITPPEVLAIEAPHFRAAFEGQIATYECPYPDGRTYLGAVTPLLDGNGLINEILVISQDITERQLAEEALRGRSEVLQAIFDHIPVMLCFIDQAGRMKLANREFERVFGWSLAEIQAHPDMFAEWYPEPDYRAVVLDFIRESTGKFAEFQPRTRSGAVIHTSFANVLLADGTSIGIGLDITERKRIEEKLRQSESQLSEAQRLASVGSWNWEIGTNTHTWSTELYRIYGLDPRESVPSYETFRELVHPDDCAIIDAAIERAFKTQEPIHAYLRIIRPDGAERIIHSKGNTVSDGGGNPIRMHGAVQDVTEIRQAEGALREAERKYRDIFENAGEGIFQSTPDGKYISANPALARMLGFASPEDLIHNRQDILRQTYVDPARREEFKRQLEEQGAVREFEHQAFRKDGSKIWISVNARAVRNEKREIQYYEGTAQDVTDRKHAEEALRQSEERYRDLVENSLDLICTHDLDGWVLSANRAATELIGYSSGTYEGGINFREILAPEVRDQFDEYLNRIRRDRVASGLMLLQTRTGEKRIWEYHSTLRTEGIDAPIVRGVARDITERKRASEALRESEERYRELFESAKDAIYVQDLTGVYTSVNRAAESLSGYDRQTIVGKHFDQFVAPEYLPLVREKLSKKLTDREQTVYEVEVIARDGRRVPIELSSALVLKHGVPVGIQGIARDITDRKRVEATLRSYSRKLIEAQEAERQHIARELHDQIGQVLTAIRINLQTVGNLCDSAESQSLVEQGLSIIDSALDQVRSLSFELRPSILDGLGLVAALRWYSDQYARRTGIRTKTSTNLPQSQTRLRQELETGCFRIVQEALTNVVRHANAKNVSINLRKVDHHILLSIKDDGTGFDEMSANGGASSIQLGLRGMKERALALSGTLDIKSVPAQGTEVCASFPIESSED